MNFEYRPLPPCVTIDRSSLEGLGLMAVEDIPTGTCLGITHYKIGKELIRTPLGGFINHSDNPNCFISEEFTLNIVKPIKKGEELTVYYRFTQS